MKQVTNPYLPLNEYIPDGEPHVFGERVYIFGSHDKEGGYTYCMLDYVCYSASIYNLKDWRYEGVIYKASQDPQYPNLKYMYAPDVVRGNDGLFYLYYSMGGDYGYGGYKGPISVARADSPIGPYEFIDFIRDKNGNIYDKYILFDPAVMNDNGVIRLYYGTQYDFFERDDFNTNPKYMEDLVGMFYRPKEEILSYPDNIMGPVMAVLEDDMITIKEDSKHIIPYNVKNTTFEAHPFFEGSSMRKIRDKYYFIYSSWQNHELCYAISDYPDKDFTFGGTIVSNGDVGLNGRDVLNKLNMTGTTHGSVEYINGKYYVFFHRLTHKSDYSRQAVAEEIVINDDYSINQVEITSCGLNGGPLLALGKYSSVICCNLTNNNMPHGSNSIYKNEFPNVNNIGDDRFIAEIEHGTLIGYKYFRFNGLTKLNVVVRSDIDNKCINDAPVRLDERGFNKDIINPTYAKDKSTDNSYFEIRTEINGECIATINLDINSNWTTFSTELNINGIKPLYLIYHGNKKIQLKELEFIL